MIQECDYGLMSSFYSIRQFLFLIDNLKYILISVGNVKIFSIEKGFQTLGFVDSKRNC